MKRLINSACLLVAVLALIAPQAHASTFGINSLTGDGDSGISNTKTYTHAFDMARNEANPFFINGVQFAVGNISSGTDAVHGGSYTATGLNRTFQNHPSAVSGGIGDAIDDFFYRAGAGNETITLKGLTAGQAYKTVFYTSNGYGGQEQTITFSDTGLSVSDVDRNSGRIEYTYNAPVTGELTYTFSKESSGSFHQYAFTNEESSDIDSIMYKPIAGLFNTGVNGSGNALGANVGDPHYDLIVQPNNGILVAETVANGFPIGPWLANDADSRWIGPDATQAFGPGGDYTYRTTFDLSGLDADTAYITGGWATDNGGVDILLNGVSVGAGQLSPSFGGLTSFILDASVLAPGTFVGGINTLDFVLNNAGTGAGPTGLRVDNIQGIAVMASVPEPATATLALLGLGGLMMRRRRNA
jgi:hypothetical protein